MTQDTTGYDTTESKETLITDTPDSSTPPLCLVHYFTECLEPPPRKDQLKDRKPPGSRGRVIAREGNLIVLEFAAPPQSQRIARRKRWQGKKSGKSLLGRVCDLLMLLLLLASFLGCLAAFHY